jgi:hypothetical protein
MKNKIKARLDFKEKVDNNPFESLQAIKKIAKLLRKEVQHVSHPRFNSNIDWDKTKGGRSSSRIH